MTNIDGPPPSAWTYGTLYDAIASVRGGFSVQCEERPAADGELGVLKTGAVLSGQLDITQQKFVPALQHDRLRTPLRAGSIVLCRKNSEDVIGASAFVERDHSNLFLSDLLWEIRPKESIDPIWLLKVLQSSAVRREIKVRATGTQHSMTNISHDKLLSIHVAIPPETEQRRIADILSTWDRGIETLDQQIARKETVLNHLRLVLLQGKRRLGQWSKPWPIVTLGEVAQHLTARNGVRYGRECVMGVTKAEGLVPMKDHIIAADLARYLVLPPHAFAYNPMRINIGSIVMSEAEEEVIVSPDYVVFACNRDRCDPRFLNHLRRTWAWQNFVTIAGNGSVRVRIYYADLADFEFHLPPLQEQARITEVLDDAEREVRALRVERRTREKQWDALATELLTGQIRVPNTEQSDAAVSNDGA
jgi:type I restriction enzyme S subunit